MTTEREVVLYLLESCLDRSTYLGVSDNLQRRLRQHNGLATGGGRYTSRHRHWRLFAYVRGFDSRSEALRLEYRAKHCSWRPAAAPMESHAHRRFLLLSNMIRRFPHLSIVVQTDCSPVVVQCTDTPYVLQRVQRGEIQSGHLP